VNTLIFFINTDVFLKLGQNPDDFPHTWEEIVELGKTLTVDENGDGKIDRYAIVFWQSGFNMYAPFLWANGGTLFSEDGKMTDLRSRHF